MARFKSPWYTPGGNAPRFYSHVRARVARTKGGKVMDGGKLAGIQGIMTNHKNKVGGLERSKVGYKIMFKGSIEFMPEGRITKADGGGGTEDDAE